MSSNNRNTEANECNFDESEYPATKFRFELSNIRIRNMIDVSDPYIKFSIKKEDVLIEQSLGGGQIDDSKKDELPYIPIELRKSFSLESSRLPSDERSNSYGSFKDILHTEIDLSVADIQTRYLTLELYEFSYFRPSSCVQEPVCVEHIPLVDILGGNVRQEIIFWEIAELNTRKERASVKFDCIFEELFTFKFKVCDLNLSRLDNQDFVFDSFKFKIQLPRRFAHLFKWGGFFGVNSVISHDFPEPEDPALPREHLKVHKTKKDAYLEYYSTNSFIRNTVIESSLTIDGQSMGSFEIPFVGILETGVFDFSFEDFRIQGHIIPENIPSFVQQGIPTRIIPGYPYIGVYLQSSKNLMGRDSDDCVSDVFFIADFKNGQRPKSSVIYNTVNPVFNEILVCPLPMYRRNEQVIGDVLLPSNLLKIIGFDEDMGGSDFLGQTYFEYDKLLKMKNKDIDLSDYGLVEIDGSDASLNAKTKDVHSYLVNYDQKAVESNQGKSEICYTVLLIYDESVSVKIPENAPVKIEKPEDHPDYHLFEDPSFFVKNEDSNYMLPCELIAPLPVPPEFDTVHELHRLSLAMPFATDEDVFNVDSMISVWHTLSFIGICGKGDSQEHSLLFCSLCLGLGIEAFVVRGDLTNGREGAVVLVRLKEKEVGVENTVEKINEYIYFPGNIVPFCLTDSQKNIKDAVLPIVKIKYAFNDHQIFIPSNSQSFNDWDSWKVVEISNTDLSMVSMISLIPAKTQLWAEMIKYRINVEIRTSINLLRNKLGKTTEFAKKSFLNHFVEILKLRENELLTASSCHSAIDIFEQKIIGQTYPGHLCTYAEFNFIIYDAKEIQSTVVGNFPNNLINTAPENSKFFVVPVIYSLPGNFASVWVIVGVFVPE
eukprot:TRINITY_DN2918_c0_g2_i2.p1 TRINITY_DN2918_c0_g2~~TRINITY_DN2918_c0_g2_i2.p1  ORF type:complete len:892 (-),score=258.99 TRINITY_DN2918_c0_g2_i2:34-2682(-)